MQPCGYIISLATINDLIMEKGARSMDKRKISVDDIEDGMIAAEDVVSENGDIVVRKNIELDSKHLCLLNKCAIKELNVLTPHKPATDGEKTNISDYPAHSALLSSAKVLVVDDSKLIRAKLTRIVAEAGLAVAGEAEDGFEAVAMAKMLKPTLITLDIEMDKMDGIQAIQPILKAAPDTKIVMISSLGSEDKIIEAISEGAVDFINKPFDPERVKKTLISTIITQSAV